MPRGGSEFSFFVYESPLGVNAASARNIAQGEERTQMFVNGARNIKCPQGASVFNVGRR
jgi:hypothetical protein